METVGTCGLADGVGLLLLLFELLLLCLFGERVGVGVGVDVLDAVGVVVGLGLYEGDDVTLGDTLGVGVILGLGVVLGVGDTEGVGVTVKNIRPRPSRSSSGLITSLPACLFAPLIRSFMFSDIFSAFLRRLGDRIESKSKLNASDAEASTNSVNANVE